MHIKKGTSLKYGSYVIESVLGQGGFGITYMAVQSGLNRKVAIKEFFMREHCERDADTSHVSVPSSGSRELVERFKTKFIKEAQTIAEMDNEHIIRIHDVFEENGTAYYVMEYLESGSLTDCLPESGLPEPMAVKYIRQIADALRYIHEEKHILHLDVKPSNVMLRKADVAVLIDFGISKHYDEGGGSQTSSTPVGVSKGYAPLEQYKIGGVSQFSPATDIYSLGATLYKLLTGQTPPDANDVNEDGLPDLPQSVSSAVRSAVEKAMQPRRKDRPQSVGEFLALLDGGLTVPVVEPGKVDVEETDLVANDVVSPVPSAPSKPSEPSMHSDSPEPPSSGKRHLWWLWMLILGLVAGVVSYVVFSGGEDGGSEVSVVEQPAPSPVPPVKPVDVPQTTPTDPVKPVAPGGNQGEDAKQKAVAIAKQKSAAQDMSSKGRANCYIVSKSGTYKFRTVKGNSSESVGRVAKAEVLWESFGTSTKPSVGALVRNASYNDGYITFETASTFREGNAVIAAKDASGKILWSWHIWLTDQPQGQTYYNGAGTMMDRNLGATSAAPGEVGALGLLYQWGRKDPFLGSSSISSNTVAESTISWPSPVSTSSSRVIVSDVTANPTTFVTAGSSSNYDWHYSYRNNTLWTTSDKAKSIYDPCPAGWRVPDGGGNGVWSKALGSSSYFTDSSLYSSSNKGMNFYSKFGRSSSIWYPASGYRYGRDGSLYNVGNCGYYWSASPSSNGSNFAYGLSFNYDGYVNPSDYYYRAYGRSVRCLQE